MRKNILLLSIFCFLAAAISAQNSDAAKKTDELRSTCCEQVRAQLDNYLAELQNAPEATGYIVFYGGKAHPKCMGYQSAPRRGELSLLITALEQHVKFRKFPAERIVWLKGGYKENWVVEFWIGQKGGTAPALSPEYRKKDIKYRKGEPYNLGWSCEG